MTYASAIQAPISKSQSDTKNNRIALYAVRNIKNKDNTDNISVLHTSQLSTYVIPAELNLDFNSEVAWVCCSNTEMPSQIR